MFERPELDTLRERVKADIMARLPGTDALLRWNNLGVVGEVQAGGLHLLYGRLDWSFRQLFPDTAEAQFVEQWASIWGVTRRAASRATGAGIWDANASTSIPTGTVVTRGDGTRYIVTTGASVGPDGTITVSLEAEAFGATGNAASGVQLTMSTTRDGVTPLGRVIEPGVAGGADAESDAMLLARLLMRIRNPPRGGTATDYLMWAFEVPGVTRAWVYPLEDGPGTVVVRFMMDEVRADQDGIPDAADVALMQVHLDEQRPITAQVTAIAPAPNPLDVHIAELQPDTPEIRAAVEVELLDTLRRYGEPGQELYLSRIFGAINTAPGVRRFRLLRPDSDFQSAPGQIPVLGEIAYD